MKAWPPSPTMACCSRAVAVVGVALPVEPDQPLVVLRRARRCCWRRSRRRSRRPARRSPGVRIEPCQTNGRHVVERPRDGGEALQRGAEAAPPSRPRPRATAGAAGCSSPAPAAGPAGCPGRTTGRPGRCCRGRASGPCGPCDRCCSIAYSSAMRTGSLVVISVVEVVTISCSVGRRRCRRAGSSARRRRTAGCGARRSRRRRGPTSSVFFAICTIASIRSASRRASAPRPGPG